MIYWDNNATTPVTAEVFAAMEPFFKDAYANPSSNDAPARAVRRAIDEARQEVALLMGASAGEIIFTSGATESINTTLRGMVRMNQGK
ncbi:MAG: aminotransferase class V-fold PLP-dependent enzyme, partial [Akkermansia sp.]